MKTRNLFLFVVLGFETFAQGVGGGGSTGGGFSRMAARNPGCEEGRRSFLTVESSSGRQESRMHVCHNGTYADLSSYIYEPKSRCQEGRKEVWVEDLGQVFKLCKNGKWIDRKP